MAGQVTPPAGKPAGKKILGMPRGVAFVAAATLAGIGIWWWKNRKSGSAAAAGGACTDANGNPGTLAADGVTCVTTTTGSGGGCTDVNGNPGTLDASGDCVTVGSSLQDQQGSGGGGNSGGGPAPDTTTPTVEPMIPATNGTGPAKSLDFYAIAKELLQREGIKDPSVTQIDKERRRLMRELEGPKPKPARKRKAAAAAPAAGARK